MKPIISQNDLFLDTEGKKIPGGRIFFLDPDTTNAIDIFTYHASDDSYVAAENPIYLNVQSRAEQTYFTNQLTLVRVYKYIGNFSDPRVDDNDANFKFVREFYAGESTDDIIGSAGIVLHGLNDLISIQPPEEGTTTVTVVGYWTSSDCEARTYIWDPASTESPDNGYVVKSSKSDSGRWILKFDGEYLPSTYYGVYPGHEENINVLLSFNDTVGTTQEFKTAGGVYFAQGDYAGTVALVTTKKLQIDSDTHFVREIQCDSVEVVGIPTAPIAEFYFTGTNAEAHSSWFRSIQAFWSCNAKKFIIDPTNVFYNTVLTNDCGPTNAIIEGHQRLPISNYNNHYLRFNNCIFVGENFFNQNDRIYFSYTDIKDIWWNTPSAIDFGTNVQARGSSLNRILLDNFVSNQAYANAMFYNGATEIDYCGRRHNGSLSLSGFTHVMNLTADTVGMSNGNNNTAFDNCTIGNLAITCNQLTVNNSNINFGNEPTFSAAWFNNSTINGYQWTTGSKQIIAKKCHWGINLKMAVDNTSHEAWKQFDDCTFTENTVMNIKYARFTRCVMDNVFIKIYPYKTNDVYYNFAYFRDNVYNCSSPIEFTNYNKDGYNEDPDCYDVVASWTFVGNTFLGNNEGIRCRYWAKRTGSAWNNTFIKHTKDTVITYEGNKGYCPKENMIGCGVSTNTSYQEITVTVGTSTNKFYLYGGQCYARICPDFSRITTYTDFYKYTGISPKKPQRFMKYYSWVNSPYNSLTYDLFFQSTFIYNKALQEQINDGDFFNYGMCTFSDYIRIIQRGDNDRNQGVVGFYV